MVLAGHLSLPLAPQFETRGTLELKDESAFGAILSETFAADAQPSNEAGHASQSARKVVVSGVIIRH